jgi:hypothetical protein
MDQIDLFTRKIAMPIIMNLISGHVMFSLSIELISWGCSLDPIAKYGGITNIISPLVGG